MDEAQWQKNNFLRIIDGTYDWPAEVQGIDSYTIGLCGLRYEEDSGKLHVHLRRPGLLIGPKGATINAVQKLFGGNLCIHEVDIIRDDYQPKEVSCD